MVAEAGRRAAETAAMSERVDEAVEARMHTGVVIHPHFRARYGSGGVGDDAAEAAISGGVAGGSEEGVALEGVAAADGALEGGDEEGGGGGDADDEGDDEGGEEGDEKGDEEGDEEGDGDMGDDEGDEEEEEKGDDEGDGEGDEEEDEEGAEEGDGEDSEELTDTESSRMSSGQQRAVLTHLTALTPDMVEGFKVPMLKQRLLEFGLSNTGLKAELKARLLQAMQTCSEHDAKRVRTVGPRRLRTAAALANHALAAEAAPAHQQAEDVPKSSGSASADRGEAANHSPTP